MRTSAAVSLSDESSVKEAIEAGLLAGRLLEFRPTVDSHSRTKLEAMEARGQEALEILAARR